NRLIRCVCGKKIGPDPRNFNQRVSLGRNDLLIRTFPKSPEPGEPNRLKKINDLIEFTLAIHSMGEWFLPKKGNINNVIINEQAIKPGNILKTRFLI
ncbi:hypothetical protein M2D00_28955, partial [Klebsiella pneumoniae]|nr:hypothetical protein [Klebsiella pneumoniae]